MFPVDWARANLGTIIDGILHPMRGAAGTEFGRKARTSVLLQSRRWPWTGLARVGTNAAKYGALSNDEGCIEIAWTVAPHAQGREFRLRWRREERASRFTSQPTGFGLD